MCAAASDATTPLLLQSIHLSASVHRERSSIVLDDVIEFIKDILHFWASKI